MLGGSFSLISVHIYQIVRVIELNLGELHYVNKFFNFAYR